MQTVLTCAIFSSTVLRETNR